MFDTLPPHEPRTLSTRHLGRRLLVFPQLDSTNTLALALAHDPAHHGLALLAEEQTAGRGQYGRLWQAPPRSSVLMSLLLFPPAELRRPAVLVAWVAVAVCRLVGAATGLDAMIKWPNDVLVGGKKVCGILIEQRASGGAGSTLATVVGIGLNVTQSADLFEAADLPLACSMFSISGEQLDTEVVACTLIEHLDAEYGRLLEGDLATLEEQWRQRLALLNRRVRIEAVGRDLTGRLVELALDTLRVQLETGELIQLAPESVRHITPDP
jgi:BirA family transcriptional regulator, biotin operon repressor / biotin---[acetyl-CoA-carboxylase] ligase